jgi:hypothetical protein
MKKAILIEHKLEGEITLSKTWYIVQYCEDDLKAKNDDFVDSKTEANKLKKDWENA